MAIFDLCEFKTNYYIEKIIWNTMQYTDLVIVEGDIGNSCINITILITFNNRDTLINVE